MFVHVDEPTRHFSHFLQGSMVLAVAPEIAPQLGRWRMHGDLHPDRQRPGAGNLVRYYHHRPHPKSTRVGRGEIPTVM